MDRDLGRRGDDAVLLMVAYVGEAIREAFDPKQFTYYE